MFGGVFPGKDTPQAPAAAALVDRAHGKPKEPEGKSAAILARRVRILDVLLVAPGSGRTTRCFRARSETCFGRRSVLSSQRGTDDKVRDRMASAIVWVVIVGLGIADAEGFPPARYIAGVLTLIWLACVAVPWIISELPPPWRRRH